MKALRKPLPAWLHRVLAVPGLLIAIVCFIGFLLVLGMALFGGGGMRSRAGLGIVGLLLLTESLLSLANARDFLRVAKKP